MEKEQYRSVIRFLILEEKSRSEIKERLDAVYGDYSPSMATVKNRFNEFQRGRTSHIGFWWATKSATTEDDVNKIHDLVLADRRLKLREVAETSLRHLKRLRGSYSAWESRRRDGCRVCSLRTTSATVRLLQSTVWRYLSAIRRIFCVVSCPSTKHGSTGIHQRPRNNRNSGLHPANVLRRWRRLSYQIGRKGYRTVFWDSQGVIYIDYLENGKTVTELYYAELLGLLQKKRPHLVKKKTLFHHDNAPAHTSAIGTAKLIELSYELLPYPPYSPDLAPRYFFLFPNLKQSLPGQKFESNEETSRKRVFQTG